MSLQSMERRGGWRVVRARVLAGGLAGGLGALLANPAAAAAQAARPCRPVCAPSVTLMPGVVRTHLFGGPRVEALATGTAHRLPGSSAFEMITSVAARTAIPRVSLVGSVQWLPNASAARNPFTLYTAQDLGSDVHANAPTFTLGAAATLVPAESTRGWLDLSAIAADLFSQAARPDDRSAYTHKLDLDLVTHLHAFAWTPPRTWVHGASVYGILDYVATGLPRAGDEVPKGRRFVSDARPAALVVGLALPITPSAP